MSPHAKTPSLLVMKLPFRATFPRASYSTPRSVSMPSFSGPTKPIARSTRSHGSSKSVPSTFSKRPSTIFTSCATNARTLPCSSPTNFSVFTLNTRSPPSSCADDTRKMFDHCGHGFVGARFSGGRGRISS